MPNEFATVAGERFRLDPAGDIRNLHGAPGWFELTTPDPQGAATFLGAVFGWRFQTIQLGGADYRVILVNGHEVGGIKAPLPGGPGAPHWDTYVTVADVEQTAAQARSAGGEVVIPPTDLGDAGRLTAIQHPSGGRLLAFEYPQPFK